MYKKKEYWAVSDSIFLKLRPSWSYAGIDFSSLDPIQEYSYTCILIFNKNLGIVLSYGKKKQFLFLLKPARDTNGNNETTLCARFCRSGYVLENLFILKPLPSALVKNYTINLSYDHVNVRVVCGLCKKYIDS